MTLFIDNFTITGNADELVEFLKKYNTVTYVSGSIGNSKLNTPADDVMEAAYHGIPITSMSDIDLAHALVAADPALTKEYDLETLSREELIKLLNHYATTSVWNI